MSLVCLHDKAVIEGFLRRNPLLHIYPLGDLDDFFWPHTTWYGLQDEDGIEAIALLFCGLQLPCLLAIGEEPQPVRELVAAALPLLPSRFYCHLTPGAEPAFALRYRLEPHGRHLRMGLGDPARMESIDTAGVTLLTAADAVEIRAFYAASYPGNWFELLMLASGQYVGLRMDGRLAAIAGVHVCSPRYRVAALGNIATHPDHRRRGHAVRVTAALCRRLLATCDHIGLNVKADNAAALHCYRKLGFEVVAEYEEYMAESIAE